MSDNEATYVTNATLNPLRWFQVELAAYLDYLNQKIEEWLFTPEAKEMARAELVRTRLELGDDSPHSGAKRD